MILYIFSLRNEEVFGFGVFVDRYYSGDGDVTEGTEKAPLWTLTGEKEVFGALGEPARRLSVMPTAVRCRCEGHISSFLHRNLLLQLTSCECEEEPKSDQPPSKAHPRRHPRALKPKYHKNRERPRSRPKRQRRRAVSYFAIALPRDSSLERPFSSVPALLRGQRKTWLKRCASFGLLPA